MKIGFNQNIGRINSAYGTKVDKTAKSEGMKVVEDSMQISSAAKEFQIGMKAARSVSDVRMEKIESIKTMIESGTYNVAGRDVAEKMIESAKASLA